jgi:glycosyltransferase involved in cell wall biosynthesis
VKHDLKGYGNALRRGFAEAQGTFVIMGDADDSYDFTDLGRFVDGLRAGADVVMGNRLAGEVKPGAMPWLHRWVGNPGLTFALNLMFQTGVGDTHCGMRGFRKDALRKMNLQMPGMELASELVIKGRLANLKVTEIPITLYPDGRDRRPHLRSFRDGWRHLRFMLMCAPWFLFVMPGALLLAVGLLAIPVALAAGYGVWDHYFGPNFLFGASVAALTGFHLIVFGILAKVHANLVDPVFRDPRMDKLARVFRVERGALYGGALLVLSALLGLPVLWTWFTTSTVTARGNGFSPAPCSCSGWRRCSCRS